MFIASDLRNGVYVVSGAFCGPQARERAMRWAGSEGKVTRLRSVRIWASLRPGQPLPKRYS